MTLEEKTGFLQRESRVWNVSVRGWLAIFLIGSVCVAFLGHVLASISLMIYSGNAAVMDGETLKLQVAMAERLALVALGYYFGKEDREQIKRKPPQPEGKLLDT
jgi:hypothetical protein